MNHRDTEKKTRRRSTWIAQRPPASHAAALQRLRSRRTSETQRQYFGSLCFRRSSRAECRPAQPADVRRLALRVSVSLWLLFRRDCYSAAPMPERERLHGSLSTVEYFTFGFGTMIGVGWLVLMDDWL